MNGNKSVKVVKVCLGILMIVCLAIVFISKPDLIVLAPLDVTEFLQMIAPLFLFALFIERALEIFLTAWRGGESAKLALKANRQRDQISAAEVEEQHLDFSGQTQKIALLSGLALGILVSSFGVRVLESFVDADMFEKLADLQKNSFHVFDVFITGCVLGGGADGLHKIVSVFTNFMDSTNKQIKAKNP